MTERPFDPERHCGAKSKTAGTRCRQHRGHRTDHPGSGRCWLHGGRSPGGRIQGQREMAQKAIAKLGIPIGTGDPFVLLEKAVRHAEGYLEATGAVLAEVASKDDADKGFGVAAVAQLHADAIRAASRTGKAAVDADVAERRAVLDERAANMVMRFVRELLEHAVPEKRRPAIQAWAASRLAELAAEYDGPVH